MPEKYVQRLTEQELAILRRVTLTPVGEENITRTEVIELLATIAREREINNYSPVRGL